MIFHSLDFVVFFVIVTAVYWRLPHRGQNLLLLVASYFFYGYVHPWFLILIATSTVIDYFSARGMEQRPDRRRLFMGISIVSNFGMLGFFKYFNFFVDNVHAVLEAAGLHVGLPVLRVILPVGISFYTFQAMSYTVDVFRGELRARRSLLDVAVFISFFPHLVAGPIQRASYLLPQVEQQRRFDLPKASSGFYLMVWGFFKKLVIADNVGVIANKVFALQRPVVRGALGRGVRVRDPDLRRLLGLHRHRARLVALARLRADRELRSSLPGAQPGGFLAPLEHLALDLVPRLRLHPARRLARVGVDLGAQRARSRSCCRGCGTARAGTTCCGACTTACCWW